jgi:hypothetical protein
LILFKVGNLGLSKASVLRAVHEVTALINKKMDNINFPDTEVERRKVASEFFKEAHPGMPNVAGALDGSLIPLAHVPSEYEWQYVDRHAQHSINAMAVSGPNLKFFFASACWPG